MYDDFRVTVTVDSLCSDSPIETCLVVSDVREWTRRLPKVIQQIRFCEY